MNIGVVSRRYAKALYEYAKEHNAQVAVYENMKQLKGVLREAKELPVMLKNPSLTCSEKVALVCSAIRATTVFEHFIALVVKNGREDMLLYIAYAYIEIYRKENNVVAMKVTTAVPMPGHLFDKVERVVARENASVEVKNIVDESIIGGFLCEADNVRLDASVSNQLARIRKKLIKSNKKIV